MSAVDCFLKNLFRDLEPESLGRRQLVVDNAAKPALAASLTTRNLVSARRGSSKKKNSKKIRHDLPPVFPKRKFGESSPHQNSEEKTRKVALHHLIREAEKPHGQKKQASSEQPPRLDRNHGASQTQSCDDEEQSCRWGSLVEGGGSDQCLSLFSLTQRREAVRQLHSPIARTANVEFEESSSSGEQEGKVRKLNGMLASLSFSEGMEEKRTINPRAA